MPCRSPTSKGVKWPRSTQILRGANYRITFTPPVASSTLSTPQEQDSHPIPTPPLRNSPPKARQEQNLTLTRTLGSNILPSPAHPALHPGSRISPLGLNIPLQPTPLVSNFPT